MKSVLFVNATIGFSENFFLGFISVYCFEILKKTKNVEIDIF